MPALPRPRRGFTLIELIVVILILGILAAIAVVGYTQIADRAKTTAASTQLATIATSILSQAALDGRSTFDRDFIQEAMTDGLGQEVTDGLGAAGWTLLGAGGTPATSNDVGVAFLAADGTTSDDGGPTALLVATGGGGLVGHLVSAGGTSCAVGELGSAKSAAAAAAAGVACDAPGKGTPGTPTVPPTATPTPTPSEEPVLTQLATPTDLGTVWMAYPEQIVYWAPVDGATGYKAVMTDAAGAVVVSKDVPTTELVMDSLTPYQRYTVTVTATAEGAVGTPATFSFDAFNGYVAAPTGVSAVAKSTLEPVSQASSAPSLEISWTASARATGYRVVATPAAGGAASSIEVGAGVTAATLTTGLKDGAAYTVAVYAEGMDLPLSSKPVNVSTLAAPTNLQHVGSGSKSDTFTATLPAGAIELRITVWDMWEFDSVHSASGAPGTPVTVTYPGWSPTLALAAAGAVYPDGSIVVSPDTWVEDAAQ